MAQTEIDQGFQADPFQFPTHWALLSLGVFFIYLKTMLLSLHFCKNNRTFFCTKQFCKCWQLFTEKETHNICVSCISRPPSHPSWPDEVFSSEHGLKRTRTGIGTGVGAEQISPSTWRLEQGPPHSPVHSQRSFDSPGRSCCFLEGNCLKKPRAGRTQQPSEGKTHPSWVPCSQQPWESE